MEFTEEIRQRFMKVSPANIGHQITGGFMKMEIKPVADEMKVCGPAYTIQGFERDSTSLYYAMQKAPKGSVLVIDRGTETTYAWVGEFVAIMAQQCGMAGIIIDGPASKGAVQIPISCGGTVVKPGDIILGDADGVIVVPEDFLPYLETAEKKEAVEIARREFLANGGIYNKRPDFDVVKLFEYDMDKNIQNIKNNECKYD